MPVVTPPPPPNGAGPRVITINAPQIPRAALIAALVILLILLGFAYYWFVQRVEVSDGHALVLVRRWGQPLGSTDQVVLYPQLLEALGEPPESTKYQGILLEALPPGRYFYDPFFWRRQIVNMQEVGEGEAGILIRNYGQPLPAGRVVARKESDERGPVDEVLSPGKYALNPYAYDLKHVPGIKILPGFVGVQTLYHGAEPSNPNAWVVATGERGVQPDVLPPGFHRINPYVKSVEQIDVRVHTLDLRGADAIRFPSKDSFEILIEATIEYGIRQDRAPYVMVAIGDHDDIEEKLILPYARSFARIEGSKLLGREFIAGETREQLERRIFEGLYEQCGAQGIEIRAAWVRRVEPPAAIAEPIKNRQIAGEQIKLYQNRMEVAEADARLVEQEELQNQNKEIGVANRGVVTLTKEAEQEEAVALTEASKRLAVAKLQLQAAEQEAAAILSRGKADADVVLLNYLAEAGPLRDAIAAFGDGETYAQFYFYQKLSPALRSILASTDGPFADIFKSLSTSTEGKPPRPRQAPAVEPNPSTTAPEGAAETEGGEQE